METVKLKKYILMFAPYVFIFFIAVYVLAELPVELPLPIPDVAIAAIVALLIRLIVYVKSKNAKKYRKNVEYGSARWGTEKDIQPYMDPKPENNLILTATESLTMNSRPKPVQYARNKNILVVGGSGSGKTRFFVKPNLMQCDSKDFPVSFVVTDPKGTLLLETGSLLQKRGYRIKVLNTIQLSASMRYNPFASIKSERDILKFVTTLIANTKGDAKSGDDFWVKAEQLLYQALIGYIYYEAPPEEQNMNALIEMINVMEVREADETFQNAVDFLFEALEEEKPDHFAVRQYKKYKLAAGKTAKSILISCAARLSAFDIDEVRDLVSEDELELDTLGDRKTAFFVIISDTDASLNFIIALMYSQLFNLLCDKADNHYGGRLPVHVRFILDEFANIGMIPNFEKLIATIRSREISAAVILQAQSQLKALYKDHMETIIGNCDTTLFLGSGEKTTLKEISELLGKETIDLLNRSKTYGNQQSHSQNDQKLGKALMTADELSVMPNEKCILRVRGERPFFSNKYNIEKHKSYRYLADHDPKHTFDINQHLSTKLTLKANELYTVFELDEFGGELEGGDKV